MEIININKIADKFESLNIDYFLTSSSFEERCICIADKFKDINVKSFIFYNSNEYESVLTNSFILMGKLRNSVRIKLNTDDPVHNFQEILNVLLEIIKIENSNILIDITTFTHESLLVLLKALKIINSHLGKIYIGYSGASEYSFNESNDNDKWLSKGIKEIRTVIGFPGIFDPIKKNHLLILFGFELDRTERIIEEYQFDSVTLGFANLDESIQPNHHKINESRHKTLLDKYHANDFNFSLIDAKTVKYDILNYLKNNNFDDYNTVIAPMNNKISTLGAGLAALENENIQITYAQANIYNLDYSKPNDDVYFGELVF